MLSWRYIPFKKYNPFLKAALNEVAIKSVKTGKPIVWISGWDQDCVSVGCSQQIREVVDVEASKGIGVALGRRQGGGGAMFLSKDGEISWNIFAPEDYFPGTLDEKYVFVCQKVIAALKELGIESEHKPMNDIVTDKGKISGVALVQEDGIIYACGTLLYRANTNKIRLLLRPERDGAKTSLPEEKKKISSVGKLSVASFEKTLEVLEKNLLLGLDYVKIDWTEEELKEAEELSKKYQSEEWIYQR